MANRVDWTRFAACSIRWRPSWGARSCGWRCALSGDLLPRSRDCRPRRFPNSSRRQTESWRSGLAVLAEPEAALEVAGRGDPEVRGWIESLAMGWWAYLSTPVAIASQLARTSILSPGGLARESDSEPAAQSDDRNRRAPGGRMVADAGGNGLSVGRAVGLDRGRAGSGAATRRIRRQLGRRGQPGSWRKPGAEANSPSLRHWALCRGGSPRRAGGNIALTLPARCRFTSGWNSCTRMRPIRYMPRSRSCALRGAGLRRPVCLRRLALTAAPPPFRAIAVCRAPSSNGSIAEARQQLDQLEAEGFEEPELYLYRALVGAERGQGRRLRGMVAPGARAISAGHGVGEASGRTLDRAPANARVGGVVGAEAGGGMVPSRSVGRGLDGNGPAPGEKPSSSPRRGGSTGSGSPGNGSKPGRLPNWSGARARPPGGSRTWRCGNSSRPRSAYPGIGALAEGRASL
jgi:hypothetical protein